MPTPLPIACSLMPEEATDRAGEWRELAAEALIERERKGDGVRLRFRAADGVEGSLRALVAAERECCPFLDFELASEEDELVLRIAGPPQALPILDAFALS